MEYSLVIEKIAQHYKNKLPFVLFSLPESETVKVYLQTDAEMHSVEKLSENGFVIAPFNYEATAFYIPEKSSEIFEAAIEVESTEQRTVEVLVNEDEKSQYIKLIDKTIEIIKKNKAKKIVFSRYKDIDLKAFSIEKLIKQLFSVYSNTFRYVWFHPETGIWCGATPETLVHIENNCFKTMSLAGTQKVSDSSNVQWGIKEIDEQQLVTDSITNNLQRVTSVLKVSNPYTHRAGQLLHLRTDISGICKKGKATLATIASALHPTPAVCGITQKFAEKYLSENEGYSREFYTGFLGPITDKGASATLMVNLRCMKIEHNIARVFVGGGITLGSNSNEEWQETQNKMQTMLHILQPML